MAKNKKFEVKDLLNAYQNRVSNIQFLKDGSKEKGKIETALQKLHKIFEDKDENKKWAEVHEIGQELWKNLASCALNSIDPNSKGNSKLYEYLVESTKFEDLLYGLEDFYRDHTLHSLWVYFIGDKLLREDLKLIYDRKLNWYLYNDIKKEQGIYDYEEELVDGSELKRKGICEDVAEHKDAIWCIIALCHDLGYSLAKLNELNKKVRKVLKFFDVSSFRDVGYSLDVEHQHLVAQFLELMAMDIRIEPGEEYSSDSYYKDIRKQKRDLDKLKKSDQKEYLVKKKDYEKKLTEKISIKCYRDDSTYWRLCRALERKEHGILSSYLIYKILGIFAESSVRGTAEVWGLNDMEAKRNIIRGDILFAIAQHDFNFAHLNQLGSLADILIIADELEEFSRLGRPLLSRNYSCTMADTSIDFKNCKKDGKIVPGEDIDIIMEYHSKHESEDEFFGFISRKAKRLCSIYSLERSKEADDDEGNEKENYCTINSIRIIFQWNRKETEEGNSGCKAKDELGPYFVHLSNKPGKTIAGLPNTNLEEQEKKLEISDDELCVVDEGKNLENYLKHCLKEYRQLPVAKD